MLIGHLESKPSMTCNNFANNTNKDFQFNFEVETQKLLYSNLLTINSSTLYNDVGFEVRSIEFRIVTTVCCNCPGGHLSLLSSLKCTYTNSYTKQKQITVLGGN
jgi:hypothetical protein